jgi:hypothetical protein
LSTFVNIREAARDRRARTRASAGADSSSRLVAPQHWDEGRIPFSVRIGVTGHRDLADPGRAEADVNECLRATRDAFAAPETEVKFTVLSALAEGADRLVVHRAFGVFGDAATLQAVLPLDPEDYRTDFPSFDSKREFDILLAKARVRHPTPGTADRDEAYERAGRYIVDQSDVVIALWNGYRKGGRGGTSQIIEYAGKYGVPVVVIPTARLGERDRGAGPRRKSPRRQLERIAHRTAYARVAELNHGSTRDRPLERMLDGEWKRLAEVAPGSLLAWHEIAAWFVPRLVRADALAIRYQKWYHRLDRAMYALAALAVAVVATQSQAGWSKKVLLAEVGCMLALVGIYAIARTLRLHERWIGYRSLAENFRSALFIALASAPAEGVGLVRVVDLPWFQRAFSEAWSHRPAWPTLTDDRDLRRFLISAWAKDQACYHRKTVKRFARQRGVITVVVFVVFGVTLAAGLLHAFDWVSGDSVEKTLVVLAIVLPAVGAALTGIRDTRQYRLHEVRSTRAANRLERLAQAQGDAESVTARRLAEQIQTVIRAEAFDWSGVIEFQDIDLVT